MSGNAEKVLKLDDLFGQARPVKVTWKGAMYELARPEAFTPVQYHKFTKLYSEYSKVSLSEDTDPNVLDEIITNILDIMNPKLVEAGIPFSGKVAILKFYAQEALTAAQEEEKSPNSTGA